MVMTDEELKDKLEIDAANRRRADFARRWVRDGKYNIAGEMFMGLHMDDPAKYPQDWAFEAWVKGSRAGCKACDDKLYCYNYRQGRGKW
jgi:hypothetical protein